MNEEKVTTIDGAVDNSTEHAVEHHDMKTEGHMVNNFDHQFDQETVLSLLLANQAAIKSLINKLDSIVERMQELSCRVYNIGDELSGITSYINENSNRVRRLEEGYDFIQGSRFIKGGIAINTPLLREIAVRLIHAPIISITAKYRFTDTTNAYRGYSIKYLTDSRVQPFRDIFMTYELLAYLSVRASQLGLKVCEIPVTRAYPKSGKVPTKISFLGGNWELLKILFSLQKFFKFPENITVRIF